MAVTTLSSREFNQDTSRAKKAAERGPVFITDRGRPAHVLLSIEEYQKLAGRCKTLPKPCTCLGRRMLSSTRRRRIGCRSLPSSTDVCAGYGGRLRAAQGRSRQRSPAGRSLE